MAAYCIPRIPGTLYIIPTKNILTDKPQMLMIRRLEKHMEWDEVYKQNYESKAFWNIHWLNSAQCLLASAKELEPKIAELWENYRAHSKDKNVRLKADHFQGPYFMLVAFALENLFKAVLVSERSWQYKQEFREKCQFPKDLKGHDLVALARKANYGFGLEEEDLLRRLTRHAVWEGRYPVPILYKKSAVAEEFSDGKEHHVSWFGGNDLERLKELVSKVSLYAGVKDA